jgi:hypothetical protein
LISYRLQSFITIFSFEVILSTKTTSEFKKFKIWILKTISKEKTTNMKVCRYWRVMKLCSWQCFGLKSSCHAKLCLNFLNYIGWKNHQNKICRSWNVMKLCNCNISLAHVFLYNYTTTSIMSILRFHSSCTITIRE